MPLYRSVGLIGIHARAAEAVLEQASDLQRLIANDLGGQAEARATREQAVLRIAREQFLRDAMNPGGRLPRGRCASSAL